MDDASLLQQYVSERSDRAFAEIVNRYGGAVYAAARRQVASAHLAEEVAQATFVVLAQKAHTVPLTRALGAWLLTTTHYVARNARRSERRLRARELASARVSSRPEAPDRSDTPELASILDEALTRLHAEDRDAIVWRFFESYPLAEIGRRCGISEDAARKRVARAVQRLRQLLRRHGLVAEDVTASLTTLALASPLTPPLRETLSSTAHASPAAPVVAMAKGGLATMAATKSKLLVSVMLAALLLGGAATTAVLVWLERPPAPATATGNEHAGKTPHIAQAAEPDASPAHPQTTFDDGTVARLAGVRFFYARDQWWGADGTAVPPPSHGEDDQFRFSLGGFESDTSRAIEIRVAYDTDDRGAKSFTLRPAVVAGTGGATHYVWDGPTGVMFCGVYSVPRALVQTELLVGLASGPWTDADVVSVADAPARAIAADAFKTQPPPPGQRPLRTAAGKSPYRILSITEADGQTRVEYTDNDHWPEWGQVQWQAMIRTKQGRMVRYKTVDYPDQRMIFVYDVPLKDVVAAVYQTRAWQWKPLGSIALKPIDGVEPPAQADRPEERQ